jgi:hypothetical protein
MFELISPEAIGLIIGVVSVGYNWVQKHDMSMLEKNFKEVIAYFDPDDTGQATVPETVKTVPDIPGRNSPSTALITRADITPSNTARLPVYPSGHKFHFWHPPLIFFFVLTICCC